MGYVGSRRVGFGGLLKFSLAQVARRCEQEAQHGGVSSADPQGATTSPAMQHSCCFVSVPVLFFVPRDRPRPHNQAPPTPPPPTTTTTVFLDILSHGHSIEGCCSGGLHQPFWHWTRGVHGTLPASMDPLPPSGRFKWWWCGGGGPGGAGHLGLTHTQRGRLWTADSKNSQTAPATTSTAPIRQLPGAADAQTAHPATSRTAPAHQRLGSVNAETTPAGAPAAAADRTQRPDATCEGKTG